MRSFACSRCGQLLFFENSHCLRCGAMLGFVLEKLSLEVVAEGSDASAPARALKYKRCKRSFLAACNWLVSEPHEDLCVSCRLTTDVPELRGVAELSAFAKAEAAKRRLIYQLHDLRLPYETRADDPAHGLGFAFGFRSETQPIMTGHCHGLITLDLSECDDVHREQMRSDFGEPYRTLVGHFRHEVGHYYWQLLLEDSAWLPRFRAMFGDERESYADALQRNYQRQMTKSWTDHYVSAYAASHPWEDWAETFAHYLHIRDTLQTAATFDMQVSPRIAAVAPIDGKLATRAREEVARGGFASVIAEWLPLTYLFNAVNRSMGREDLYPFVLAGPVIDKLCFVHELVQETATKAVARRRAIRKAMPSQDTANVA